jgi:hypothetical protein
MNIDRKSIIFKIFYSTIILALTLTQIGLAPLPQSEIPPIEWNIELTDGLNWEALKPDSEFDPYYFCYYENANSKIKDLNCSGDQFFGIKTFTGSNSVIVKVVLVDGSRYILRKINEKWFISCFNGIESDLTSSTTGTATELTDTEVNNLETAMEKYKKAQEDYHTIDVETQSELDASAAAPLIVCGGVFFLVALGDLALIFTGIGSLAAIAAAPGILGAFAACIGFGSLISVVTKLIERQKKLTAQEIIVKGFEEDLRKQKKNACSFTK